MEATTGASNVKINGDRNQTCGVQVGGGTESAKNPTADAENTVSEIKMAEVK